MKKLISVVVIIATLAAMELQHAEYCYVATESFTESTTDYEIHTENPSLVAKKLPQTVKIESAEQVSEENESETEAVFEGEVNVLTNRLTSEDNEYPSNVVSVESAENSSNDNYEVLTNGLTPTEQETEEQITETTEEGMADEEAVTIQESEDCTPEYKPSIGGQPNPFNNDISTLIEDRPVEDYISEGEDLPGEGIHF